MKSPSAKSVRCAIYTRVSTEHGLDQEFNSLDAQYEAASAYIKSQAHAGWTLIRSRYDDGGYSGGSTDRPDLQRLLEDIRARKIDVIVVYKVDRLTRSLADFAKLVELFDAHGVSFVSVTQQFNTTTSMGRLTLNVLLSFAQFEREVTSERIRDKIAASKRKGLWVGGNLPLGYEMKDGKIAIVDEQAELVRSIFQRYLELSGVNELVRDLKQRNIRTKIQHLSSGKTRGGIPFGRGALYYLLSNHFYIGEVKYKNEILPGEQPPIMDRELFEAAEITSPMVSPDRRAQQVRPIADRTAVRRCRPSHDPNPRHQSWRPLSLLRIDAASARRGKDRVSGIGLPHPSGGHRKRRREGPQGAPSH
jgi:DNA invertase Pin-like site-specific DNA recombinase